MKVRFKDDIWKTLLSLEPGGSIEYHNIKYFYGVIKTQIFDVTRKEVREWPSSAHPFEVYITGIPWPRGAHGSVYVVRCCDVDIYPEFDEGLFEL